MCKRGILNICVGALVFLFCLNLIITGLLPRWARCTSDLGLFKGLAAGHRGTTSGSSCPASRCSQNLLIWVNMGFF